MSGKWTKGPWVVGPVDDTVVTHMGTDGARYEVAAIDGDYNDPETWPIMEANARLIAAAPDLAEAAEIALERMPQPLDDQDMSASAQAYRRVRAALLKAKGE